MSTTRHPLPCAAFALLPLLAAGLAAQTAPGNPAPELQLTSVLNAPRPFATLAELRGSAVLLEFWGTWCGPCRAVLPKIKDLDAKYRDHGLVVLAISINETEDVVAPFATQNDITFPLGFDLTAAKAFGVRGVPHTFLLDREGIVAWAGHPARLTEGDIEAVLDGARPFVAPLTGQLEPVQQLLDRDHLGRAWTMLAVLQKSDKLEAPAKVQAEAAQARLAELTDRLLRAAQGQPEPTFHAVRALVRGERQFEGHARARDLAQALQRLAATDAGKAMADAARKLDAADVMRASGDEAGAEKAYTALTGQDGPAKEAAGRELRRIAAARERR